METSEKIATAILLCLVGVAVATTAGWMTWEAFSTAECRAVEGSSCVVCTYGPSKKLACPGVIQESK